MHRLDASQISASNFSYLRFPLERWLDDMAGLEVQNVELWGVSPHLYVEDARPADVERVRAAIASRDLNLTCFTPEQVMYPINIAAREDRIRERSVEYFFKCVEACNGLECPKLFLTPGWGYVGEDEGEIWKRSADSLRRIVERAAEHGVTAVLEALQPVESHVINSSAQLRRMLDEVGHPSMKAAVDVPAMAVAGETVADYTRAFGADLAHAHFVDGAPDGHLAWGDGELPLERYLQEFAEGDFTGYLSFELIASRYWLDPLPPVRQSIERIKAALAA